jgi:outer membrane protein assembly factor BamB
MRRVLPLAVVALVSFAPLALAVIQTATPLKLLVKDAESVFVAETEKLDAAAGDKTNLLARVTGDLKGQSPSPKVAVVLEEMSDPKSAGYLPNVKKRFTVGSKSIWFVTPVNGAVRLARVYSEGTWLSLTGTQADGRTVWRFANGEPFLRGSYKGTSAELEAILKDHFQKKAPLPKFDDKEKPGYGPELPAKQSRLHDLRDRIESDRIEFRPAVIPMIAVGGPIAILAILFPTVFGGVLVLFRQWTAFIAVLSINGMILLVQWLMGSAAQGTWLDDNRAIWIAMTLVTLVCTVWAWRRQLENLASGIDALETPGRTELLVLTILTVVCAATVVALRYVLTPAPKPTDPAWNMTLALTGGIFAGLVYKLYRSSREVMLPMATEGVMLSVALLVSVLLLTQHGSAAAANVGGGGEKWRFPTKERGFFVSPPLVVEGEREVDGRKVPCRKVLAAASLPRFRSGCLNCIDLATGEKDWDFIDNGTFKQVFSAPTVSDGRVFIGEGFHEDPNCKVYAIDLATGTKIWERPTTSQTESSPLARDGKVYTGAGNDGFLCLDAARGDVVWQFPPKEHKGRLLRFGAGAAFDNGRVYVGTGVDRLQKDDKGETALFCLDATTGKQLWKTPMPEPVWAAPVVQANLVFVAVGNGDVFKDDEKPAGAVFALDASTGAIVWKRDLPNGVLQKPALGEGLIYVGCRDGRVYAIDSKKGDVRWSRDLESPVIAAPVVAGSVLYAVASGGQLACLNAATGQIVSLRTLWFPPSDEPDLKAFFGAPPAVSSRREGDATVRTIVVGGGDAEGSNPPVLICIEDRDGVR